MASVINASTSSGLVQTADTSGVLQLQTASTTAVTVDASQNVGIGTTSPSGVGKFAVVQYAQSTTAYFANANASWASDVVNSYSPSGTETSQISLSARSDGTSWLTSAYGAVLFRTGSTIAGTAERMRIDSSGNVLINQTAQIQYEKLGVTFNQATQVGLTLKNTNGTNTGGFATFYNSSGVQQGAIIQTNSTTTAYQTSSDYRLKENVAPMVGALNTVAKLKPVTYTWISTQEEGQGFIAHELQEIVPDCVSGVKDDVETYTDEEGNEQTRPKYQGIDTSFLVATLTAAIQEQTIIINDLKARITALEGAK